MTTSQKTISEDNIGEFDVDYWVLLLDGAGNNTDDEVLGGTANDFLHSLQQTTDGGYVLGGWSFSKAGEDKTAGKFGICAGEECAGDFWVVKTSAFPSAGSRLARAPENGQRAATLPHKLFPTPTRHGRVTVHLAGEVRGRVHYSLVSAAGRKLTAGTLTLRDATTILEFDFSHHLPATGMYYLKLAGNQGHQVLRIMRE